MPSRSTTSTTFTNIEYIVVEESTQPDPSNDAIAPFDPQLVANALRAISRIEQTLLESGLTPAQRQLVGKIRTERGYLWRMVPEGY